MLKVTTLNRPGHHGNFRDRTLETCVPVAGRHWCCSASRTITLVSASAKRAAENSVGPLALGRLSKLASELRDFFLDSRTITNPQVSHRGTFTILGVRNRTSAIIRTRRRHCALPHNSTSEGRRLIRADNPTQWRSSTTSRFRRIISTRTGELAIGTIGTLMTLG